MPRKPNEPPIVCQYFTWRLLRRDGVYYADGRGAKLDLGKHSLGTRDREQAITLLRVLDHQKAVEKGLADAKPVVSSGSIAISEGWKLFLDFSGRSSVMGGVSPATLSSEAAGALYRDPDGEEFRGDDALFKALLNGATAKSAGYLTGMSERTVFRRLADPEFRQRLENARELVRDSILSRLTDAAGDAVDALHQLLDEDEPSVKLGAAKALLDALVKVQNATPKQTTTVRYSVEQTKDA